MHYCLKFCFGLGHVNTVTANTEALKIRDSAKHIYIYIYIYIIQSLKEKQQERNSTSQNKGLLQDDKTAKNQAVFHIVLGFYLKKKGLWRCCNSGMKKVKNYLQRLKIT
jgi:hypothetical protein